MALTIYTRQEQAFGQFNHGAILENKPIGFPQDGGPVKPYANILYWAHAWTPGEESLIGEHPHQGFEILSFVISGSLQHYDSKRQAWQDLNAGDVQIIRAGSGITHAERVRADSSFFQLWFDPDLRVSTQEPASYDNYPAGVFKTEKFAGAAVKKYTGPASPLKMSSRGVEIYEIVVENSSYSLTLERDKTRSFYVLEGNMLANNQPLKPHDFVRFEGERELSLAATGKARVFVIDLLSDPGYPTYARQHGLS